MAEAKEALRKKLVLERIMTLPDSVFLGTDISCMYVVSGMQKNGLCYNIYLASGDVQLGDSIAFANGTGLSIKMAH